MSTILAFDYVENNHILNRRTDCMKKFCSSSIKKEKNMIDFEQKFNVSKTRIKIKSRCKIM